MATRAPAATLPGTAAALLVASMLLQAVSSGSGWESHQRHAPRGREFDAFEGEDPWFRNATQTLAVHDRLHGGQVPFPPMTAPPSAAPHGLPFLFVHLPKNAGTSIRQVRPSHGHGPGPGHVFVTAPPAVAVTNRQPSQWAAPLRPRHMMCTHWQTLVRLTRLSESESHLNLNLYHDASKTGTNLKGTEAAADVLPGQESGSTGKSGLWMDPRARAGSDFKLDACIPDAMPCPLHDGPLRVIAGHFRAAQASAALLRRNGLPRGTTVPCLTYIRKPVERLVSFYYWMLHRPWESGRGGRPGPAPKWVSAARHTTHDSDDHAGLPQPEGPIIDNSL
jgi:hypothetical protein